MDESTLEQEKSPLAGQALGPRHTCGHPCIIAEATLPTSRTGKLAFTTDPIPLASGFWVAPINMHAQPTTDLQDALYMGLHLLARHIRQFLLARRSPPPPADCRR